MIGMCLDSCSEMDVLRFTRVVLGVSASPFLLNVTIAISLATRFYDPLGVISSVKVRFTQLFQKLCEKQLDWLTEELLT